MKLLGDLNFKEFETLVKNNEKLYNEAVETAEFLWGIYTDDYLSYFKGTGIKYEINCCGYSYIHFDKCGKIDAILDAVNELNREMDFYFRYENFETDYKRLSEKVYDYMNSYIDDDRFYKWFEKKLQGMLDFLCNEIMSEYDGLMSDCIEVFYDDIQANEREYYTDGQDVYIIKTPAVIDDGKCFYKF